MHIINEDHFSVAPLRVLLDPITALTDTVREVAGHDAMTVILFGSIARGEATIRSDIDLAVIDPAGAASLGKDHHTLCPLVRRLASQVQPAA